MPETTKQDKNERLAGLSERIRKCASLAGSGEALSRKSDIPRRTLEMYLAGETEPKAFKIADIARSVGVSGHWLLTGDGPMALNSSTDNCDGIVVIGNPNDPTLKHPVSLQWLKNQNLDSQNIIALRVSNNEMYPAISHGDILLIDTSQKALESGGIYALKAGGVILRRIQMLTPERVALLSDNDKYQSAEANINEITDVLGKVVYIGKTI